MLPFSDEFYHTWQSEIFVQSQCIRQEHEAFNQITKCLENQGYAQFNTWCWTKNQKKVIVCLVDNFAHAGALGSCFEDCYDSDTVVITANQPLKVTNYTVKTLPDSFIGIYAYRPKILPLMPSRRFHFSVNRMDQRRMVLLLELIHQSQGTDSWLKLDHANFNCFDPTALNLCQADLLKNFNNIGKKLTDLLPEYRQHFYEIQKYLPIRNHTMTIEQSNTSAWLNIVVETYAGDDAIALSEKTFRALQTPSPWQIFACRTAVSWLRARNFDLLDDVVDHYYDFLLEKNSFLAQDKIKKFFAIATANAQRLSQTNQKKLQQRCLRAALHNQKLLAAYKKQWPQDFAKWIADFKIEFSGK